MTDVVKVPAGAKKPADRKPPKPPKPREEDGRLVVTVRGVEVRVDKDALDDFELLDMLARSESEGQLMPTILRQLVGDDGFTAAMGAVRNDAGRVTIAAASEFIAEIFQAINPNS